MYDSDFVITVKEAFKKLRWQDESYPQESLAKEYLIKEYLRDPKIKIIKKR